MLAGGEVKGGEVVAESVPPIHYLVASCILNLVIFCFFFCIVVIVSAFSYLSTVVGSLVFCKHCFFLL